MLFLILFGLEHVCFSLQLHKVNFIYRKTYMIGVSKQSGQETV
jgi:hypothetical protein